MANLSQPDDNMIPGQTYTFQLSLKNLVLTPSLQTIQTDLEQNAPSFISNLQVVSPGTYTTGFYNCQFTYAGDGSDVISDVANSLIAAIQQGSGDSFAFVGAVPDTAQSINVSLGSAAQKVSDSVQSAVNNAVQGIAKTTANAAQTVLTPIEVMFAIVVGAVLLIIFTSGKAGGVNVSETGVGIGGRK